MNPNANSATTAMMCRIAAPALGAAPRPWTAPEGPLLISTPEALDAAARGVAAAEIPEGTTGVIVSAFGDPGAEALAARLSVPVVGIGAAAARACNGAFAVATTTPALAARIDALMRASGRGAYLGCFLSAGDPDALMQDPEALDRALLLAVGHAAKTGARQVIIGGGPLGAAADRLAGPSPVALVNPIAAAAAELRLRLM